MATIPLTALAAATRHPYPLIRGGGLFLICVGTGLLLATVYPRRRALLAIAGGVSAVPATALSAVLLPLGPPSTVQILALLVAVLVEVGLLAYVLHRLRAAEERVRILTVLAVVGIHFLIMGLSFGPLITALGILAMANAAFGLRVPHLPLPVATGLDSLLKIVFGTWMLVFHPAVTYGWVVPS
jgi:hypothetical protein